MSRSVFLLLTAIVALLVGGMMSLAPDKAAETFGMTYSPEIGIVFRWLGVTVISSGVLNFVVRKDSDTSTLKAILIFTGAVHALSLLVDIIGIGQGILSFGKLIPGMVAHSLVTIGCVFYTLKIKIS